MNQGNNLNENSYDRVAQNNYVVVCIVSFTISLSDAVPQFKWQFNEPI